MNDPVQLLIDAGAIPSTPFVAQSRYNGVEIAVFERYAGDPGVAYVRRRFIPAPEGRPIAVVHRVSSEERPDLLGSTYLGDALLFWQIADANAVVDPNELTDTLGRRVLIPQVGV